MVKLIQKREVIIDHEDFSITWRFPLCTDSSIVKVRRTLLKSDAVDDEYLFDTYLMNSIHSATGFETEDGPITEFTPEIKVMIYNYIKTIRDYWTKVVDAYRGITPKNSSSGQTHSSTGTGDQTSAPTVPDVTQMEPVSNVQTPSGSES